MWIGKHFLADGSWVHSLHNAYRVRWKDNFTLQRLHDNFQLIFIFGGICNATLLPLPKIKTDL